MDRERTASRSLPNRPPLYALVIALTAALVPSVLLSMPDGLRAGAKQGFRIKLTFREGSPISIPVKVDGSRVRGTWSGTTHDPLGRPQHTECTFNGSIDEANISGRLKIYTKQTVNVENVGDVTRAYNSELDNAVLTIDGNSASSDWHDLEVRWNDISPPPLESGTMSEKVKLSADLTPLIESGYEFAPAGTNDGAEGEKTVTTTGTEQESNDKAAATVAVVLAGLGGLLVAVSTFLGGAHADPQTAPEVPLERTGDERVDRWIKWSDRLAPERRELLQVLHRQLLSDQLDKDWRCAKLEFDSKAAQIFSSADTEEVEASVLGFRRDPYRGLTREQLLDVQQKALHEQSARREELDRLRTELKDNKERYCSEFGIWKEGGWERDRLLRAQISRVSADCASAERTSKAIGARIEGMDFGKGTATLDLDYDH